MKAVSFTVTPRGSFRKQIILTFTVGFFVLISVFVTFIVKVESDYLYRDNNHHISQLAQTLAANSVSWVLANDLAGLQEVVHSIQKRHELRYAMLISPSGQVLAHSDASKVGQFVADRQSLALITATATEQVIRDDESVIDIAVPVTARGRQLAWARISYGRNGISDNLREILMLSGFFILLSTILSIVAALLIARRLGSRIGALVQVAKEVQAGNFDMRANMSGGDEFSLLGNSLDQMLDAQARSTEKLRQNEHGLAEVQRIAHVGGWRIDTQGEIIWSDETYRMHGVEKESFTPGIEQIKALVHVDDQAAVLAWYKAYLAGTKPEGLEIRVGWPDGSMHYLRGQGELIRDPEGKLLYTAGSWQDVSEQRRYEDELRKLSSCVEQSGEAILITDRDGSIEYINPAFSTLTGYTIDEVKGKNPRILNSGHQGPEFYRQVWETILQGTSWQGKVIDKRKDGSFYPALLTISPIHDQSDVSVQFTHFIGIQSDLTQIEDAEAKFQQAQKMEALGTLVGGIAHDFNNMLAGITGNLYLAKKKVESVPDAVRRLDVVEGLAFKAGDMISQLLTFARKNTVDLKAIPLTSYVKETMKLLSVSVPENIKVSLHACNDEMQVYGDTTQIHQMLMNLINNARDALDGVENPEITVGLESFTVSETFVRTHTNATRSGEYARITISDNGCGISSRHIDQVFDPFFTTKEQGKGTGLGLAMVYGGVKTHGGFVEVESDAGRGTSFYLYLPLLDADEKTASATLSEGEPVQGKGECILLVDDEVQLLETGKDVLVSLGYTVLTAKDGKEAVELFKTSSGSIDLVLLDVVMPIMGGMAAYQRMREIRPDIKAMFFTGYDKEQTLDKDLSIASADILGKPLSASAMSHAIRRKLDG